MANDSRSISGSVSVENDNRERVAFDFMKWIAAHEPGQKTNDRKYWLELYSQCHLATHGSTLETILRRTT